MAIDLSQLDFDPDLLTERVTVLEDAGPGCIDFFDPTGLVYWDIETGPLPEDQLRAMMAPFPDLEPFDESSVKLGNLKDQAKINAKIATARKSHVENYSRKKAEYEAEFFGKAALDPMRGRVIIVSYGDDEQTVIHAGDENDVLTGFWEVYRKVSKSDGRLVGWNTHKFDLPFVRMRSFKHDVPVPSGVLVKGRYWADCLVDLMCEWCGSSHGYETIDRVAQFLDVGGKNGDGADFAREWDEDREQAVDYAANDIRMLKRIGQRMGL